MEEETEKQADEESKGSTDEEIEEGSHHTSNKDHDSDVSFQDDDEEEIDSTEKEDWIEYIRRSTKEAAELMARRIVPYLKKKRCTKRVFDWNPGLDNSMRTRRQVRRPKKRWEDDFNEFLINR